MSFTDSRGISRYGKSKMSNSQPAGDESANESKAEQNRKDQTKLDPMVQTNVGLYIASRCSNCLSIYCVIGLDRTSQFGWETTSFEVLIHEFILLGPTLCQPGLKVFLVIERNLGNSETSPMHVDRGWRSSL